MKPLLLASALLPIFATACVAQQDAPAVAAIAAASAKPLQTVETVPWRSTEWRAEPVRLLGDLIGFDAAPIDTDLDNYGGLKSQVMTKTGFFHAEKAADGRWWMVDPGGNGFINRGVNTVTRSDAAQSKAAFATKFGGETQWAAQTAQTLHAAGFNSTACWSDDAVLMKAPDRLPYAPRLNLMGSYKNSHPMRSAVKGRKTTYPADTILAFDPDFVTYCDAQSQRTRAVQERSVSSRLLFRQRIAALSERNRRLSDARTDRSGLRRRARMVAQKARRKRHNQRHHRCRPRRIFGCCGRPLFFGRLKGDQEIRSESYVFRHALSLQRDGSAAIDGGGGQISRCRQHQLLWPLGAQTKSHGSVDAEQRPNRFWFPNFIPRARTPA